MRTAFSDCPFFILASRFVSSGVLFRGSLLCFLASSLPSFPSLFDFALPGRGEGNPDLYFANVLCECAKSLIKGGWGVFLAARRRGGVLGFSG